MSREYRILAVMALHDLTHAYRYSDKVILLSRGRVYSIWSPKEVLVDVNIEEVYSVIGHCFR